VSKDGEEHDKCKNLLEHRHPVTLAVDNQNLIYVGDSIGDIHIYYYNE
jgi:hypothetical protein